MSFCNIFDGWANSLSLDRFILQHRSRKKKKKIVNLLSYIEVDVVMHVLYFVLQHCAFLKIFIDSSLTNPIFSFLSIWDYSMFIIKKIYEYV